MTKFIKYFRVLFLSPQIGYSVLQNFTEDHIQRIIANNPGGIFTTILTAITAAYNAYFGDLASKELNEAVRENKTAALNESRINLLKLLSDNEKLVKYTYRNDLPVYQDFYPQGLTEYQNATTAELEVAGTRYKDALANHAADFTPAFVTEYNTVFQVFKDNRAAQQLAKGAVSGERQELGSTKAALAEQLTRNLLTIAAQYVGNGSMADVYFNQQIIDDAFKKADRKVESNLDPSTSEMVFDNVSAPTTTLRVTNNSEDDFYLGFTDDPDGAVNQAQNLVPAGHTFTKQAAEMGWTSVKKYLVATNDSGIVISYVVEKI